MKATEKPIRPLPTDWVIARKDIEEFQKEYGVQWIGRDRSKMHRIKWNCALYTEGSEFFHLSEMGVDYWIIRGDKLYNPTKRAPLSTTIKNKKLRL